MHHYYRNDLPLYIWEGYLPLTEKVAVLVLKFGFILNTVHAWLFLAVTAVRNEELI